MGLARVTHERVASRTLGRKYAGIGEYTPVIFHQTPHAYRMLKVVRAEPIVDAASSTQFCACSSRWIARKGLGDSASGDGAHGLGSRQASCTRRILACYGRARIHVRVCRVGRSGYLGLPSRPRQLPCNTSLLRSARGQPGGNHGLQSLHRMFLRTAITAITCAVGICWPLQYPSSV